MAILKFFIYLSLIFLPFGELLRLEFGNVTIKPLDVSVGLAAITYLILIVLRKCKLDSPYTLWIGLFALVGFVSLIVNAIWLRSNEFFVALLYLIRWGSYALLTPLVMHLDKQFKKSLAKFLFVDGLIILVFGFLQFFIYPDLRNLFYLGWDEHLYRMFSTFLDPNFAGAFFVCYFIFVATLLWQAFSKKDRNKKISLSVLLFVTLIAIFLTFSRSALLMLLVSSGVFLVFIRQKKLFLFLLGSILLAVIIISPFFYIENTNLFRVNSSKARLETTENAFKIVSERPLLGVGFNAYRYAQQMYGFRHENPPIASHADSGVDNSFLFILATTGVIGFGVFLALLWTILKRAYILFKKKQNVYALIVFSSFCGLFVNTLFINSLFFPAMLLQLFIMIGLMEE